MFEDKLKVKNLQWTDKIYDNDIQLENTYINLANLLKFYFD